MLVSFSVGNFLSFREIQTLSLIPEGLKEMPENILHPYLYDSNEKLLKSVAIYGHNSFGKTNLIKAFQFLRDTLFSSFSSSQTSPIINVEPFRLNTATQGSPSFFEVIFLVKQTKYRYKLVLTSHCIVEESLYYAEARIRENYLFERHDQEFKFSKAWNKESNKILDQATFFTKPHVPFLSILFTQNIVSRVSEISQWFSSSIIIPDNYLEQLSKAKSIYTNTIYREIILKFIRNADIGFTTIFDKVNALSETTPYASGLLSMLYDKQIENFELYTKHLIFDENKKEVGSIEFELQKSESAGSIKYFIIVCFLAYAIKNSCLVWIDELDSRFDSLLLEMLVKSFHDPEINLVYAQMIFTTHNTMLLDNSLRRDQMVVVEKDKWGESHLRRLHSAQTPLRIGKSIEKEYRKGKLGGVSKKLRRDTGPTLFDNLQE